MSTDSPSVGASKGRMRAPFRLLRAAAIGFGLYVLGVALIQRSLLFPGTELEAPVGLEAAVPGLEQLWFELEGGRSEAWLLHAPDDVPRPAPAMIVAHGNYELIDYGLQFAQELRALGLTVLLVEYPGYGRSTGTPSEESVTAACLAAHDALVARPDVDAERIAYFGRSLGGGAVCALARQREPAALVLQSTFTSVTAIASSLFVPSFLIRDPFESRQWLATWGGPTLVLHGEHDEVVPFSHGLQLASASAGARLESFDCRHNDFPDDPARYWRVLTEFLTDAGVLAPDPADG